MSNIYTEQLVYINRYVTQAEIHRQTGIPSSTLSYVLSGQRELPAAYYASTNSYYSTTVAGKLLESGMSAQQASRFTSSTPDSVTGLQLYMDDIATSLTYGSLVTSMALDDEGKSVQSYIDDHFEDVYNAILDSLRNSEKPIELFQDYF